MKPAKGLYPFASWMLRISMILVAYVLFFETLSHPDFKSVQFFIALGFVLFSVLLFIGGFMTKPDMTVISAIFLFGISAWECYYLISEKPGHILALFTVIASSMAIMVSVGNKK